MPPDFCRENLVSSSTIFKADLFSSTSSSAGLKLLSIEANGWSLPGMGEEGVGDVVE